MHDIYNVSSDENKAISIGVCLCPFLTLINFLLINMKCIYSLEFKKYFFIGDFQITGQAGIQWKLLLESRTSEVLKFDLEVSDLGYDQIDGRHLPVISITAVTGM